MITTTLNRIRDHGPCADGWQKLLKHLGKTQADDEPLPFSVILESNGLADALWCCRVEPQYAKEWRLYAVWCGRQVQHLMTDQRSIDALDVAEKYATGCVTDSELDAARLAARDAAWEAAWAVWGARATWATVEDAARDAARDTWAALDAALDAEQRATWTTVCPAERTTWATGSATGAAARDAQAAEFLRVVTETEVQS